MADTSEERQTTDEEYRQEVFEWHKLPWYKKLFKAFPRATPRQHSWVSPPAQIPGPGLSQQSKLEAELKRAQSLLLCYWMAQQAGYDFDPKTLQLAPVPPFIYTKESVGLEDVEPQPRTPWPWPPDEEPGVIKGAPGWPRVLSLGFPLPSLLVGSVLLIAGVVGWQAFPDVGGEAAPVVREAPAAPVEELAAPPPAAPAAEAPAAAPPAAEVPADTTQEEAPAPEEPGEQLPPAAPPPEEPTEQPPPAAVPAPTSAPSGPPSCEVVFYPDWTIEHEPGVESRARVQTSVIDDMGDLLADILLSISADKPDGTSTVDLQVRTVEGRPLTGTYSTTSYGPIDVSIAVVEGCQPTQPSYKTVYQVFPCPQLAPSCPGDSLASVPSIACGDITAYLLSPSPNEYLSSPFEVVVWAANLEGYSQGGIQVFSTMHAEGDSPGGRSATHASTVSGGDGLASMTLEAKFEGDAILIFQVESDGQLCQEKIKVGVG